MTPSSLRWTHPTGFVCPEQVRPTVWARVPRPLGDHLQAIVVEVSADGVVLVSLGRRWSELAGEEVEFTVTVPFGTAHQLRGAVATGGPGRDESVMVKWTDPSTELLADLAGYLLLTATDLTPAQLQAAGLPLRGARRAVRYDEASGPADAEEILRLRLRSHQHDGHLVGLAPEDLRSPFDPHARHITCRHGDRIVGYARLTVVDGDPARSQYVTWSGHEVPDRLWADGFVEGGAAAIDPDYQRAGLFVPLVQRVVRVAAGLGGPHLLAGCPDQHLAMYQAMGFVGLETRVVEPRPGWRFRAHLLDLDLRALADGRCAGRFVPLMREAAVLGAAQSRRLSRDHPDSAFQA